jgi:hypothetical protein
MLIKCAKCFKVKFHVNCGVLQVADLRGIVRSKGQINVSNSQRSTALIPYRVKSEKKNLCSIILTGLNSLQYLTNLAACQEVHMLKTQRSTADLTRYSQRYLPPA